VRAGEMGGWREVGGAAGFDVPALECLNTLNLGGPSRKSEADIIALSDVALAKAPGAEGILISCGGLRTLGVAKPLEDRHRIPVVSSTPAAFWAAMRLVGESGRLAGCGRVLEQAAAPVHLGMARRGFTRRSTA